MTHPKLTMKDVSKEGEFYKPALDISKGTMSHLRCCLLLLSTKFNLV